MESFFVKNNKNNPNNCIENIFSNYRATNNNQENNATQPMDKATLGAALKDMVDSLFDPTTGMSDEEKEKFVEKLHQKIESGKELSYDEMQYLRINEPLTYAKMAKVQIQRKCLETQLNSCKSKEEAHDMYVKAMSRISEDDPARRETIAAYNDVYEEFKKSEEYEKLPNTDKEARENETS